MRVAALFDIHANLPALESVLDELLTLDMDEIIIGGDVLPGPMPVEVLDLLERLTPMPRFIIGNGDREVLMAFDGIETEWFRSARPEWREPVRWTADRLDAKHADFVRQWVRGETIRLPTLGAIRFCHATARNDEEIFTPQTEDAALNEMFAGVEADVIACGHTHLSFERRLGTTRIVNPGSVGMPTERPGAYWLLIGDMIERRRTEYDTANAAARLGSTDYPRVDEFIEHCIQRPPSAAATIAAYERFRSM